MKNHSFNLAFCLLLVFILACVCPNSENNQKIKPLVATTPSSSPTQAPAENKQNTFSENDPQSATVIAQNVNLRNLPNKNGQVKQTLVESTVVHIINQKGGWFFVETPTTKGWLHGNTIRLNHAPTTSVAVTPTATPMSKSSPSGATAQCRDGSYSYSQNHRGTCSHHGGVAVWLD